MVDTLSHSDLEQHVLLANACNLFFASYHTLVLHSLIRHQSVNTNALGYIDNPRRLDEVAACSTASSLWSEIL